METSFYSPPVFALCEYHGYSIFSIREYVKRFQKNNLRILRIFLLTVHI
nr:MAG TPA: hypothetical protein [Caudoviricetes sp.]